MYDQQDFPGALLCILWCHAALIEASKAPCQDAFFTFNVISTIKDVPLAADLSPLGAIEKYVTVVAQGYATAPNTTGKNTYTIAGIYCPALTSRKGPRQLQVLVHGSSYTKNTETAASGATFHSPTSRFTIHVSRDTRLLQSTAFATAPLPIRTPK